MDFGRFSCSDRGGLASVRPLLASASTSVAPLASPLAPVAPTPSQCPPTPRCPSAAATALHHHLRLLHHRSQRQ